VGVVEDDVNLTARKRQGQGGPALACLALHMIDEHPRARHATYWSDGSARKESLVRPLDREGLSKADL